MTKATALQEWRVTGMDCGSCAAKVRGAVEALPGVEAVEVTLMNERLRLRITTLIGLTGLWIAVMADTGATVLATMNALRLLRFTADRKGT